MQEHRPNIGHNSYGHYQIAEKSIRKLVVITNWNTEGGRKRLAQAEFSQSFYQVAHHFEPQINPFFCGVACCVTVLNALRLGTHDVPSQKGFSYTAPDGQEIHYKRYSQLTILNEQTDRIKPKHHIAPSIPGSKADSPFNPGLTLSEVAAILKMYGLIVKKHPVKTELEAGLDHFRKDLERVLSSERQFMVSNFYGKMKGTSTAGHFSILGAYDPISDSVLVLDTAAHKNPWYWVATKHLYHAMNTIDAGKYRGYLIVSE